jgi:CubicO group peptidase (beta-lactamase class C family)
VASTLLHILRNRGLLDYDDRVCRHWPEFAQAGKSEITIRQVMSHQSGLYHIRQMIDHADRMLDWDYMVHAIERAEPVHEPGRRTGYHGLTYGYLVGEIAQRVTGRPFPELVQEEIARPLELDGLYIGAPREALPLAAQLLWPRLARFARKASLPSQLGDAARSGGRALHCVLRRVGLDLDLASIIDALAPRGISSFDFGGPDTLRAAIPAANGLFTARSLARMYAMLAGGGALGRQRLLSPETFALATERQGEGRERKVIPFDMRWRLGYHGVWTLRGFPRNAFGHFGFGGSGAWADPHRGLAVGLIVNSGIGTPFGDLRIVRISGTALACADLLRRGPTRHRVSPDEGAAPAFDGRPPFSAGRT